MRIQVLCFAIARDLLGTARLDLELEAGATVDTALEVIAARSPAIRPLLGTLRVALDEEFVSRSDVLQPGSTLALLPPVSGG